MPVTACLATKAIMCSKGACCLGRGCESMQLGMGHRHTHARTHSFESSLEF